MDDTSETGVTGLHQISWVDPRRPGPVEEKATEIAATLIELEQRFLTRLLRLDVLQRRLAEGSKRKREESGLRIIRHIERERQRLGRELHTEVGQLLAAIHLQLEVIDSQLPDAPAPVREALQKVASLSQQALERVRTIARRIHPPEWQRLGLVDALRQLLEMTGLDQRFQTHVNIEPLIADPGVEINSLIYRSAQEAIANVMRHARASTIELDLRFRDNLLSLRVHDDGVGFDAPRTLAAPANLASGIGLRSVREEAAELNGKLLITSGPHGTTLEVSIPWTPGSQ